jgi:integrase
VRIPKYRRRAGRDVAFVEFGGKRHALPGRYGSAESREAYANVIRELARAAPVVLPIATGLAVDELVAAYLDHANVYYDSKEYQAFVSVSAPLLNAAADLPVAKFGALSLEKARAAMIALGWSRQYCNKQTNRVRRIFRWGVSKELVPPMVLESLRSLDPLREGRCNAPETPPVTPVDAADVEATVVYCPPVLAAMIRLQRLTGMRSQNLCAIRPMDIDRSLPVWIYRPPRHKGSWRGTELSVFIGPKSQKILKPYLKRPADKPCFSPRESEAKRNEGRRAAGKAPIRNGRPRNSQYTTDTYRQAVTYAIDRANRKRKKAAEEAGREPPPVIPYWHPHQLRHTRATEIRPKYGLEGAQVFLGHANADVTQIYAQRDLELALRIARDMG